MRACRRPTSRARRARSGHGSEEREHDRTDDQPLRRRRGCTPRPEHRGRRSGGCGLALARIVRARRLSPPPSPGRFANQRAGSGGGSSCRRCRTRSLCQGAELRAKRSFAISPAVSPGDIRRPGCAPRPEHPPPARRLPGARPCSARLCVRRPSSCQGASRPGVPGPVAVPPVAAPGPDVWPRGRTSGEAKLRHEPRPLAGRPGRSGRSPK